MSDRELLEAAAKAAGNGANSWSDCHKCLFTTHGPYPNTYEKWNPINDDGDCARMEAKLGIEVTWYPAGVAASVSLAAQSLYVEYAAFDKHNADRNADRRMASTRCAASIWRKLLNAPAPSISQEDEDPWLSGDDMMGSSS